VICNWDRCPVDLQNSGVNQEMYSSFLSVHLPGWAVDVAAFQNKNVVFCNCNAAIAPIPDPDLASHCSETIAALIDDSLYGVIAI
jgi:hypothetical protein